MNKRHHNNEFGASLVELIAALAMVAAIAAIAWTSLTLGARHTAVETNKTLLQQDANLLISVLSAEHRANDYYTLKIDDATKQLSIQPCTADAGCEPFRRLIEKDLSYVGTTIGGSRYTGSGSFEKTVEPKKEHLELTLVLDDAVTVNTTLTRLITNPD